MDRTFFAGVKSEETALCFFDLSMIRADFPVAAAKVQETLPSNKLKPVQLMPGTAVVSLAAMEYRHIDRLTPFNEFGIAPVCATVAGYTIPTRRASAAVMVTSRGLRRCSRE